MKKIIFCFIFAITMCASTEAAQYINYEKLSMGGYISKQAAEVDGELKPQGLLGVTGDKGEVWLPFEYYDIMANENGSLYAVRKEKDGLYGVVDRNNKIVVNYKYDFVFQEKFTNRLYGLVKKENREICYEIGADGVKKRGEVTSHSVMKELDCEHHFVDVKNESITPDIGAKDENGNVIVPFKFQDAYKINKNNIAVKNYDEKWGLYDVAGNMTAPCKYDDIVLHEGECYGKIYTKGAMIEYYKIGNWTETFVKESGGYTNEGSGGFWKGRRKALNPDNPEYYLGVVDSIDEIVLPFEYYDIKDVRGGEMYAVKKEGMGGLYAVVDENNKAITSYKYNDVVGYKQVTYGMIERDGKVDYYKINTDGEHFFKTLEGYVFNGAWGDFGYYIKQEDGDTFLDKKYGTVDTELNIIIKPQYDNKIVFDENGCAKVYKGSTYAFQEGHSDEIFYKGGELLYIGKDGKELSSEAYENSPFEILISENEKVADVEQIMRSYRVRILLKAVGVLAIVCGLWLVWYAVKRKMHKRQ